MDPNATLRDFWVHYRAMDHATSAEDASEAAQDAAEAAAALLRWLANGGFPPVWTAVES